LPIERTTKRLTDRHDRMQVCHEIGCASRACSPTIRSAHQFHS
jgi:hypothetical protein